MLSARTLRNRVINILDRDDNMHDVAFVEEETGTYLPAILMTQGKRKFLMVFWEVTPRENAPEPTTSDL